MTWRVVYRAKDGARREEAVEAASRAECVAACRARGISPTSIREGRASARAGSAASPNGRARPGAPAWGAAILAALVLALGGAWWWARGGRGAPGQAADGQKPVPPARGDGSAKGAVSPKSAASPRGGGPAASDALPRQADGRKPVPPETARPEAAPDQAADGQKPIPLPVPERVFKTDAETLLAMATPAEPGMDVPPLPPFSEETTSNSAERALATVAQATSNDTEQTIVAKIVVEEQKEELRALMKEGWTFADYLSALHKKHSDDAEYLREAQRLDRKLRNDASVSDAEYTAYRKKIDEELRERGIPGLTETEKRVEEEERAEREQGK